MSKAFSSRLLDQNILAWIALNLADVLILGQEANTRIMKEALWLKVAGWGLGYEFMIYGVSYRCLLVVFVLNHQGGHRVLLLVFDNLVILIIRGRLLRHGTLVYHLVILVQHSLLRLFLCFVDHLILTQIAIPTLLSQIITSGSKFWARWRWFWQRQIEHLGLKLLHRQTLCLFPCGRIDSAWEPIPLKKSFSFFTWWSLDESLSRKCVVHFNYYILYQIGLIF